jgi:cytochrome c-type biogenesis protein CcmH/NrfG
MERLGKETQGSPVILLVAGFAAGAMLTAALIAGGRNFTETPDQESSRAAALQYDAPNLSAPMQPDTPDFPNPAPTEVSSLNKLLPGLEAKVAAHPKDADLQILLARTYAELGQVQKAQELMEKLREQFPTNGRIPFASAQALMEGNQTADLRNAIHLFEQSALNEPTLAHLARLHQGQILLRLGDRQRAVQIWRDYIGTLPENDERRRPIEVELTNLSSY